MAMTYPPEGVDSIFEKFRLPPSYAFSLGEYLAEFNLSGNHYHHYGYMGAVDTYPDEGERVDF